MFILRYKMQGTLESLLDFREIKPVNPKGNPILNMHWKGCCWSWISNTLITWRKEPTHLKRPWCWETLKAKGEGFGRGWDGNITSLAQWTWIWANSEIVEYRGAWLALVHGVTKSQTWLSDWTTAPPPQ